MSKHPSPQTPLLKQSDQDFLYELARRQARLLSDPVAFAVAARSLSSNITERLPLELPRAPLAAESETDVFTWRFEPSGNQRVDVARQRTRAVETLIQLAAQAVREDPATHTLKNTDRELVRYVEPALSYLLHCFRNADDKTQWVALTADQDARFLATLEQGLSDGAPPSNLTSTQIGSLRLVVKSVAEYLTDSTRLQKWIQKQHNPMLKRMFHAIDIRYPSIEILGQDEENPDLYDWRLPRNGGDQESLNTHKVALENARFIIDFRTRLSELTHDTITLQILQTYGLIDRAANVSNALENSQIYLNGNGLEFSEIDLVSRFADSLEHASSTIANLIFITTHALDSYKVQWTDISIQSTLRTLSWHLNSDSTKLTALLGDWEEQLRSNPSEEGFSNIERSDPEPWWDTLLYKTTQPSPIARTINIGRAWNRWFTKEQQPHDVEHSDYSHELVSPNGPISYFRADSREMNIGDWSKIVTGGLRDIDEKEAGYVPAPFVPAAITALGLEAHLKLDLPSGLRKFTMANRNSSEFATYPVMQSGFSPTTSSTAILVIAEPTSPLWSWKIDTHTPTLIISFADAVQLVMEESRLESVKRVVFKEELSIDKMFDWDIIAIELVGDSRDAHNSVISSLEHRFHRPCVFFGSERSENTPTPFLLDPKSTEQFITFSDT